MKLFCGIDWAEAHHDVAIIDSDGQLVAKKRITDDPTRRADRGADRRRRERRRTDSGGYRNTPGPAGVLAACNGAAGVLDQPARGRPLP